MRAFIPFFVLSLLTLARTDHACLASSQEGFLVEQGEPLALKASTYLKIEGNLPSTYCVYDTHEDLYAFHGDKGALSSLQVTWIRETLTPCVWRGDFSCEGDASLSWGADDAEAHPPSSCRLTFDGNGLVVPEKSQVRTCQILWETGTSQTLRVDFARLTSRAGSPRKAKTGHDGCDPRTFCHTLLTPKPDEPKANKQGLVCLARQLTSIIEEDASATVPTLWLDWEVLEKRAQRPIGLGAYPITAVPSQGSPLCVDAHGTVWAKFSHGVAVPCARLIFARTPP